MKSKDDFKAFIEEAALAVAEAQQKALEEGIEANAVILNGKFAKTGDLYMKSNAMGICHLPPMLCGLRVEFAELPEKFAFVLTKVPRRTVEEMEAEVRAKTASKFAEELAKTITEDSADNGYIFALDVLRVLEKIKTVAAEFGAEVDGQ